jgi:hypothetical protein
MWGSLLTTVIRFNSENDVLIQHGHAHAHACHLLERTQTPPPATHRGSTSSPACCCRFSCESRIFGFDTPDTRCAVLIYAPIRTLAPSPGERHGLCPGPRGLGVLPPHTVGFSGSIHRGRGGERRALLGSAYLVELSALLRTK